MQFSAERLGELWGIMGVNIHSVGAHKIKSERPVPWDGPFGERKSQNERRQWSLNVKHLTTAYNIALIRIFVKRKVGNSSEKLCGEGGRGETCQIGAERGGYGPRVFLTPTAPK